MCIIKTASNKSVINIFKCFSFILFPHTKCSTFGSVPADKEHLVCFDGYHSSYMGKIIMSLKKEVLKCLELKAPNSKVVSVVTGIIFTVIAK